MPANKQLRQAARTSPKQIQHRRDIERWIERKRPYLGRSRLLTRSRYWKTGRVHSSPCHYDGGPLCPMSPHPLSRERTGTGPHPPQRRIHQRNLFFTNPPEGDEKKKTKKKATTHRGTQHRRTTYNSTKTWGSLPRYNCAPVEIDFGCEALRYKPPPPPSPALPLLPCDSPVLRARDTCSLAD